MKTLSSVTNIISRLLTWILLLSLNGVVGVNLGQFQLPPCCYTSEIAFMESPSETIDTVKGPTAAASENGNVDSSGEIISSATLDVNMTIQTFLFPILPNLKKVQIIDKGEKKDNNTTHTNKVKRTTNDESTGNTVGVQFDKRNKTRKTTVMPKEWRRRLRRVLFQSMINVNPTIEVKASAADEGNHTNTTKNDALWEQIYDAPIQVIDASTRREMSTGNALLPLESMTSPEERISGVMVNTVNGIEIRTSDSTSVTEAESRPSPSVACHCHLIHHGDTLLAYWSVGFSGNQLEYLIYPLPHNVPTPPIFESFHTNTFLRPSPIDLNPLIMSRSTIDEVPFQPSLEFGTQQSSPAFRHLELSLGGPNNLLIPIQTPPPIRMLPPNGFQFLGLQHYNPPVFSTLEQPFLNAELIHPKLRFGVFPPPYAPNVFPPSLLPARKEGNIQDPIVEYQPPLKEVEGIVPPLNPFNPNHPKSIQEIILERDPPPRGLPPPLHGAQLPPGPNLPLYLNDDGGEFDDYPRRQRSPQKSATYPPRDQTILTHPPGIFVEDFGSGRPDEGFDNQRQPGDYNYNYDTDRRDKPSFEEKYRQKEDCYKKHCVNRYRVNRHASRNGPLKPAPYYFTSSNVNNKLRHHKGKILKSEKSHITEPAYLLKF